MGFSILEGSIWYWDEEHKICYKKGCITLDKILNPPFLICKMNVKIWPGTAVVGDSMR